MSYADRTAPEEWPGQHAWLADRERERLQWQSPLNVAIRRAQGLRNLEWDVARARWTLDEARRRWRAGWHVELVMDVLYWLLG